MTQSKQKLTIGLTAVGAICIAAFAFRGCTRAEQPNTGKGAAIAPPPAPEPTPADSARKGQIYYHRDAGLAKILPGEGLITNLPDVPLPDSQNYQIQSDRLSPDATRMAFGQAVIRKTDNGFSSFPPDAIYVRTIATTDPAELLAKSEGTEMHNFLWSPDGKKVAFTSWKAPDGNRNWVVDTTTKEVHEMKLPRYKEHSMTLAAWSPDGKWFAVADHEGLLYLITMDMTGPIWKWSGRQRLTREQESILGGTCSFSPDGRSVIFTVLHGDQGMSLQMAEVDGGAERALVAAGSFSDIYGCWSPDGQRVAYSAAHLDSSGKRAGRSGIYVVGVDGNGEQPTTVLEEVHPPEIIRLRLIDWR